LALVGVDAGAVQDVILTDMHYDHVGNFAPFPLARFHLQEPEMHYVVGRYTRDRQLAKSFEPDGVSDRLWRTSVNAGCLRHAARPYAVAGAYRARHDPEVMRRYPPPRPELEGIVVRLDVMPTS
jgi:glyoxylase-like metal-dependent hydrolase (beta-lactamase superfamily II)